MNIQEYPIIEKSVYAGISLGVEHLLKDVSNFSKPEVVVDTIAYHVMSELGDVIDFGQTALKFSPTLMAKMWKLAAEEAGEEKPAEPEKKD